MAVASARPGQLAVGTLVAAALVGSTAGPLADLFARVLTPPDGDPAAPAGPDEPGTDGTVTALIRLGDEPPEVARASVSMAISVGPTVVVARHDHDLPEDLDELAPVHRGRTIEAAVRVAALHIESEAVLILSARAVPRPGTFPRTAGMLGGRIGWVAGRTKPFHREGFAPLGREDVGARLRARARDAGLPLWEPDAMVVSTAVLRDHPIPPGRPWGAWLRSLAEVGVRGATTTDVVSFRSTPLDARSFWPDAIARQRAAASDLGVALRSGGFSRRLLAVLLLSREMYAIPLLAWIALPILLGTSGAFPFDAPPAASIVLLFALSGARWASVRLALGADRSAFDDMLSALDHVPGSLAAAWTAVSGRARPARSATVPTRPLVWTALFLTLLAGAALVDRDAGAPVSKLAVGTTLTTLGLLWAFAMRSLVQRGWQRRTHRVPLALHASVAGVDGLTVDVSAGGMAATGRYEGLGTGRSVEVSVDLDDGSTIRTDALVAGRRRHAGSTLVGLELQLGEHQRRAWLAQVFRAAEASHGAVDRVARRVPTSLGKEAAHEPGPERMLGRTIEGLVVGCSLAVVGLLTLVMLGFMPLVVRSASMAPTLNIGDLILSEQVTASEIGPGDIVTQPDGLGPAEAVTHRVVSTRPDGGALLITTRGDANRSAESWRVAPDGLVGLHRWTIPWVGRAATGVRTSGTQLAIVAGIVGVLATSIVRRNRSTVDDRSGSPPTPVA
jgi:signal peptidase I